MICAVVISVYKYKFVIFRKENFLLFLDFKLYNRSLGVNEFLFESLRESLNYKF